MGTIKLNRWAERKGNIVRWGNVIGSYCGQEFEEEFNSEEEAIERERQAKACEAIGAEREPVAIRRTQLNPSS